MCAKNQESRIKNLNIKSGFTLVEISIVIIIIGLIVAGVTAGQSLVKQAKLQSLISDMNKYTVAANNFKAQYGMYPGDFNNATAMFGLTNNGNGNGQVVDHIAPGNWNDPTESAWAWSHLSAANLIAKTYTNVWPERNVSIPAAGDTSSFGLTSDNWQYSNKNKLGIYISSVRPYAEFRGSTTLCAGLWVDDARKIDVKLDDGIQGTGSFVVHGGCPLSAAGASSAQPACVYGSVYTEKTCRGVYFGF